MPELPEVETFKRYLDRTSLKQLIKDIRVTDNRILKTEENQLINILKGKRFESSVRHGKYLLVDLKPRYLVMHFGMSGDLEYYDNKEDPPKFSKVLYQFDNGFNFIYHTNYYVEARLEILEKDSIIMQAGIQIINSPSFFFSKAKKHFNMLKGRCDDYYGESLPMNIGDAKILNYGNSLSVCYLSRLKVNGRCVINFKVGNRKFW